jgi:hypothetical protein
MEQKMYHSGTNVTSTWNKARRNKIILQLWQNMYHEGTNQIYIENKTVDYGEHKYRDRGTKVWLQKEIKAKGIKNATSRGAKISADETHPLFKKQILPPFGNIRCSSFVKRMYLDIF